MLCARCFVQRSYKCDKLNSFCLEDLPVSQRSTRPRKGRIPQLTVVSIEVQQMEAQHRVGKLGAASERTTAKLNYPRDFQEVIHTRKIFIFSNSRLSDYFKYLKSCFRRGLAQIIMVKHGSLPVRPCRLLSCRSFPCQQRKDTSPLLWLFDQEEPGAGASPVLSWFSARTSLPFHWQGAKLELRHYVTS